MDKIPEEQYTRLRTKLYAMSGFLTRGRMFNETHHYYALVDSESQVHACVSIYLGIETSSVAYVDMFMHDQLITMTLCQNLVSYIRADLQSFSVKLINKLRFVLMPEQEKWLKLACACGFVESAKFKGNKMCCLYDLGIREGESV